MLSYTTYTGSLWHAAIQVSRDGVGKRKLMLPTIDGT